MRRLDEHVSTHAPRAGGDPDPWLKGSEWLMFQPTPPARGATARWTPTFSVRMFQPTPPARGATITVIGDHPDYEVSTHAPRAGGDIVREAAEAVESNLMFQPTPPARGATWRRGSADRGTTFQPTPPARGATLWEVGPGGRAAGFNPRPPRGGRRAP